MHRDGRYGIDASASAVGDPSAGGYPGYVSTRATDLPGIPQMWRRVQQWRRAAALADESMLGFIVEAAQVQADWWSPRTPVVVPADWLDALEQQGPDKALQRTFESRVSRDNARAALAALGIDPHHEPRS